MRTVNTKATDAEQEEEQELICFPNASVVFKTQQYEYDLYSGLTGSSSTHCTLHIYFRHVLPCASNSALLDISIDSTNQSCCCCCQIICCEVGCQSVRQTEWNWLVTDDLAGLAEAAAAHYETRECVHNCFNPTTKKEECENCNRDNINVCRTVGSIYAPSYSHIILLCPTPNWFDCLYIFHVCMCIVDQVFLAST